MRRLRRSSLRKRLAPRLLVVYALAFGLLLLAQPTPLSLVLGAIPILGGELLRIWATGHLHKNDELTVTGAYAFLRHPLYTGTLLIATGFAITANSVAVLAIFGVFLAGFFGYYLPYKNRIEGARLESLYDDAYRRYALAVPRLVPRLHAYTPLGAEPAALPTWRALRFADNNETGTAAVVGIGMLALAIRALFIT
jgi:protein-S-isoprenylcysteine O-methyltransferase Ste14